MKVTFELRLPADKHGRCRIRAVACFGSKRVRIPTGESIVVKNWDKENYRVKRNSIDASVINANLATMEARISELYHTHKRNLTADILLEAFRDKKPEPIADFYAVYINFLAMSSFSDNRKKTYNALTKHLQAFEKEYRYAITFENMTQDFYDKFREYALSRRLQNVTLTKYTKAIKAFLAWSEERHYHSNLQFKRFKPPSSPKKHQITLTEEELNALEHLDLSAPKIAHLEKPRDAFLFACYTGFRISDVMQMGAANIQNNTIQIITKKTGDALVIPFTKKTLILWEKHKDTGLVDITEQAVNRSLKDIAKLAGLTQIIQEVRTYGTKKEVHTFLKSEMLTFHVARRTFATLSFARGMTAEAIMRITGHKDLKTFYAYINYSPKMVNTEYSKTWDT